MVYLATQEEPIRREVALKVIKRGMDTTEVVARFQSERQALAMMDHPGIAHVYEAGCTPEGRPYFAMEYVQGIPITEYCDRKRLRLRQRLDLFVQVCSAVQHAHQKGIIHRDLKPSNVLIAEQDGNACPKIIDFGLAKALDQRLTEVSTLTRFGALIGTPEYMSPEQAAGKPDIDTRTDIYSLGLILYELLSGTLPFDAEALRRAAPDELSRAIRTAEPPSPSRRLAALGERATTIAFCRGLTAAGLRRELHGELRWVVRKTLEKNPGRRYSSISELSGDINSYLHDEALSAGPQSPWYWTRKFIRGTAWGRRLLRPFFCV